ncbi:MAG: hypothetical protein ACXV5H_07330 [Halobacteriota archaeon]
MEYEEKYHGRRIIITTEQQADGEWTSHAALVDSGERTPVAPPAERYKLKEEDRQAALAVAAEAIDRTRISTGKP